MTRSLPGLRRKAANDRPRLGIVGCGDVAHRHYLPALEALAGTVDLHGCCDASLEAAARAAERAKPTFPQVRPYADAIQMIRDLALDAVFVLTPAPAHAATTRAALETGVHVYSEKPIAGSVAEADRLIELARARQRMLLCAPGEAVSQRIRWLGEIVRSGRLGRLTLAVAHHADTGPATWREYTGDPTPFYAKGVGPIVDHGVYRLHVLTTLLGRVTRVQAMGAISDPERFVRAGRLAGQTIPVTTPDHALLNLEFEGGALGQLLASFAAPGTQAPWLELHFGKGTISFPGPSWDPNGTASIYFDDDSPLGIEGWVHGLRPPPPREQGSVIDAGVRHFVAVLRGEERPVLTAEHARHVLEVTLLALDSIRDGRSHETTTTF